MFRELFYGQWGLIIHGPRWLKEQTKSFNSVFSNRLEIDDYIIGEFLGDTDEVVVPGKSVSTVTISIASPFDPRSEYPVVARSLEEFLTRFITSYGLKYWE